tara:strand:- start:128 stop:988 length:861 start_codon:yes stop_codon:yes gene_type:complete
MKKNNYCVFILSNGRPDDVITYKTLKKCGYTGKVFIVVDDKDSKIDQYKKNFENVIVFNKNLISKKFDQFDNFKNKNTVVYARNACFEIAKKLGYKYFIQLDDDYRAFEYRKIKNNKLAVESVKSLDNVFAIMVRFISETPTTSIALAQGGDFIGGVNNDFAVKGGLKRKAMNSFVCSTDKPFYFYGRINEDVNTYVLLGSRGYLFFTTHLASLVQKQTQKTRGGMSDVYLDNGTYLKSFYSVICSPSSVKIKALNANHKRVHHSIKWINAVPKIISEGYKKYESN